MKKINAFLPLTLLLLFASNLIDAQPIPVEFMMGNKYGSINITFTRKFSPESRFGVFHLNSLEFDYDEEYKNSIILKDLLFVETVKNLKLAGGGIYTNGGLSAQAGLIYSLKTDNFLVLCNPGITVENDPVYDIMTIFQFTPKINDQLHLHARAQFLNVFNSEMNLKSYQRMRLGVENKGWCYGLAFNLDENGPNPSAETNFGVFVQKNIF